MKKLSSKFDKNALYLIPSIAWIIAMTLINIFFSSNILNSDMSDELVLADQLSKTNKLFTTQ